MDDPKTFIIDLEDDRTLNLTVTDEGVVIDIYQQTENNPEELRATFCNTYEELAELVERLDTEPN